MSWFFMYVCQLLANKDYLLQLPTEVKEAVIEYVRERPSLWNKTDQHYKDTGYRRQMWMFIADSLDNLETPIG